ncbi:hypothetical protein SDRG_10749 [Saprolegnia diclina VS20]|uniref:NET domain-containing protein n=1 Tax=Saprolegnia diclina (strain VS20) TaxID=1156394 RepID=T0Q170_SAPDV|nr:hypothetical protein SDRG_10749 [Saprolegnia diclina VS20]EQC31579.1 hypothetical protein SDRG_10749 [Saprolegnia diclina VS20]|eukprot:XP_008614978.1 hypothetical protein SDRG_10749 [Saprolegnia diclina VS20]
MATTTLPSTPSATELQAIVQRITNLSSEALLGLLQIIAQCEPSWQLWQMDFVDEIQLDLEAMQPLTLQAIAMYLETLSYVA